MAIDDVKKGAGAECWVLWVLGTIGNMGTIGTKYYGAMVAGCWVLVLNLTHSLTYSLFHCWLLVATVSTVGTGPESRTH